MSTGPLPSHDSHGRQDSPKTVVWCGPGVPASLRPGRPSLRGPYTPSRDPLLHLVAFHHMLVSQHFVAGHRGARLLGS